MTLADSHPTSWPATIPWTGPLPFSRALGAAFYPRRDLRHIPEGPLQAAAVAVSSLVGPDYLVTVHLFDDLSWGVSYCSHPGVGDTQFAAVPLPLGDIYRAVEHVNAVRLGATYRGFTLSLAEIVAAIGTDEHLEHAAYYVCTPPFGLLVSTPEQREKSARARYLFAPSKQ